MEQRLALVLRQRAKARLNSSRSRWASCEACCVNVAAKRPSVSETSRQLAEFGVERIPQYGEQPGPQIRALGVATPICPRLDERLLDEVVSAVWVAGNRAREGSQARYLGEEPVTEARLRLFRSHRLPSLRALAAAQRTCRERPGSQTRRTGL